MNGLKYIRIRCNLSLSELAEMIDVTRQALSMWENEKKEIPEQRKVQLSNFFGIDEKYFGKITEDEKKELLEKATFRYEKSGKEMYLYKPNQNSDSKYIKACFSEDCEVSLDEKYLIAQKKKKETVDKIEDIIKWTDNAGGIMGQIVCINRGIKVYDSLSMLMEKMRNEESIMKMPFFYEILSVLESMLIAYDIVNQETLFGELEKCDANVHENTEWMEKLIELMRIHWKESMDEVKNRRDGVMKMTRNDEDVSTLNLEEKIAKAEEDNKKFRQEHSGILESYYHIKK